MSGTYPNKFVFALTYMKVFLELVCEAFLVGYAIPVSAMFVAVRSLYHDFSYGGCVTCTNFNLRMARHS